VSLAATAAATLLLVIAIQIINKVAQFICRYLSTRWQPMAQPVQMQNLVILTARAQAILLQNAVGLLRWILILTGVLLYSFIITFFFPQTEKIGTKILAFLVSQLTASLQAVVNFIPSLLLILVALVVARFLLRATRLVFDAVETGRITWPGFYPDWARPTRNLVSLLVIAATLAIIFPYLPGSTSPAIQGLGLLAGALLTVGGAGTVASLISGYVIIFARPFQVGDLIAFEDYKGFVHQKSVLATQLRSLNGEILTVPNSALQSKTIVNYSAIVRDLKQPLALTTTLTIGYDVPWREVHQVLIEAASATPKVLAEPSPYVLQTSLDDFYVSYMLKMFIDEPESIPQIYSNLLQNLQDHCAAAGIEIMSPHYGALRDGNQTTIPAQHLPADYQRPGFQIDVSERSAQSRL
jgi:small-conductance mechanosensitive channel